MIAHEYMIAEVLDNNTVRPMPNGGSFYSDRWYGTGDDALTGAAAAWRAACRVAAQVPGFYKVIKVRTFERPEGLGLPGRAPAPVDVDTLPPVKTSRLGNAVRRAWSYVATIHPVYLISAGAVIVSTWVAEAIVWGLPGMVVRACDGLF